MGADSITDGTNTRVNFGIPNPFPNTPSMTHNELRGRVWNIHIADASAPVKRGFVYIDFMSWQGYNNGDHIRVEDARGNVIFEADGDSSLQPISHYVSGWVWEPYVTHMDSGTLVVHVG